MQLINVLQHYENMICNMYKHGVQEWRITDKGAALSEVDQIVKEKRTNRL